MDYDLTVHDIPNGGSGWLVAQVQCGVCGHEAISVQSVDMTRLGQCSRCENYSCVVLYYIDEEGNQVEDNATIINRILEQSEDD